MTSVHCIDPNQDPSCLIMCHPVKAGLFLWNGYSAAHCSAVSAVLHCNLSVSTCVPFAYVLGVRLKDWKCSTVESIKNFLVLHTSACHQVRCFFSAISCCTPFSFLHAAGNAQPQWRSEGWKITDVPESCPITHICCPQLNITDLIEIS